MMNKNLASRKRLDHNENGHLKNKFRKLPYDKINKQKNHEKVTKNEKSVLESKEHIIQDELSIGEIQCDIEDLHHDDPFTLQYGFELCPQLLNALTSKPPLRTSEVLTWPLLGNIEYIQPSYAGDENRSASVLYNTTYSKIRTLRSPSRDFSLEKLHIKSQIANNIADVSKRFINKDLTDLQKELFHIISNYQDLYYAERTFTNSEEIRMVYSCHAVSHALKTRMKILHNNYKISQGNDHDFRDHGLVRPKVLILVPFRDSALRIIKIIAALLVGEGGTVMNKKRFLDSYSGETIRMPKKNPKPPDYEQTFFGNTDDNFKIGLSITKKTLKLYADFYSSDIIVASPLGLRMLIGAEDEQNRNYDFLSSIEVLILDQTEIFVMQNWEHILHIWSHMHLVPKNSHGTDLTRVRMWALNGWSKYYVQTLVFCSHPLPEITSFFNVNSKNFSGKAIILNNIVKGTIQHIIASTPQIFHKILVDSVSSAVETRFECFISKILPQYQDSLKTHTLIYVPSYFDYVKIRNHFKKHDISFTQICEYSKDGKVARARDMFYHGEVHFMLYSERFHFFRRIRVKGIHHILFYQPPAFPHFYSEMCNLMMNNIRRDNGPTDMSISVLYTKYDVLQLSAIIGTERATHMLASEKDVHMFMTDDS